MASLFKILVRDFTAEEKRAVTAAAKERHESLQKLTKRGILREAGVVGKDAESSPPVPLPTDTPEK